MLGFGISDRINAIAGALIFAVSEAGGGGGRVPRAVLSWSACPPELFLMLQSSRPCCGVRILAIASALAADAATVLYRCVVHGIFSGAVRWVCCLGTLSGVWASSLMPRHTV